MVVLILLACQGFLQASYQIQSQKSILNGMVSQPDSKRNVNKKSDRMIGKDHPRQAAPRVEKQTFDIAMIVDHRARHSAPLEVKVDQATNIACNLATFTAPAIWNQLERISWEGFALVLLIRSRRNPYQLLELPTLR